jgi:hypothetical protein
MALPTLARPSFSPLHAKLRLGPGRPMTPLDMVLIREPSWMPGNAFLAESKQLRSIDVKGAGRVGSWASHRRGKRPTPPHTPRLYRRAGRPVTLGVSVRGPWSRLAGGVVVFSTAA